jgi:alanine racemase
MRHTSYIELSRSALKNNLDYLNEIIGERCDISLVVKGNAYGHGISEYVPMAIGLGHKHFSTFDANEAFQVKRVAGDAADLMIMGMIDNDQLEWAIENDVEFYVFEEERLNASIDAARKIGKPARIHIELETGMNRTGFEEGEWSKLAGVLKDNGPLLELKGLCTHYAGAESYANFLRVNEQYDRFRKGQEFFTHQHIIPKQYHTASSAAMIRLPHTRMDMVRIGILQYGFWPNMETFITTIKPKAKVPESNPLHRIISWKSTVMNTKKVKQGEYIGYGTSYLATQDIHIAVVPVGYGYGFSRSLSNTGRALVRGQRVSVIGTVNMNAIMIDISEVEGVEKGDEVVLIGKQGEMTISVSSFSEFSDQLNYELLTRIPNEIPRMVVD